MIEYYIENNRCHINTIEIYETYRNLRYGSKAIVILNEKLKIASCDTVVFIRYDY